VNSDIEPTLESLVYRDSGLLGYPEHYLRVGDLPIIVSHSFASLILFGHLHII
jgi:hypothetical protein